MTPDPSALPATGAPHPANTPDPLLGSLGILPSVFAALPSACLLLTSTLRIVAVSEAYLASLLMTRDQLVGYDVFEPFPGEPGTPEGETIANLRASLQQVLATGQPQEMAVQHYSLPDPATPGAHLDRYWQPLNSPVFSESQAVVGIIHTVVDVTATVQLQASQAPERAAYAEVERQRIDLLRLLEQTPVAIGTIQGPDFVVEQANPALGAIWGRPAADVIGHPFFEALPDLRGQGFEELFTNIRERGESLTLHEVPVNLAPDPLTPPVTGFFNCTYQPWHNAQGEATGFIAVAVDVTEQVLARRQVEAQERQTSLLNEELQAAHEGVLANNAELERVQQQLLQLNEELEARVAARTHELRQAQAATEQQREQLYQVFEQMPVAIAIMRGPNLRVELANPAVAAIWGREPAQVLGRPYFEALPDTAGQGFEQILADVLRTGKPFTITEAPVTLARAHVGLAPQAYVNFVFQPLYDAAGATVGLIASGIEVTEQVLARGRMQQLNEQLAASNEVLETRVQARTLDVQLAQQQAERQRSELQRVFEQAPVAIAVFRGPDYVIELANPSVCALWGRTLAQTLGTPLFTLLPEAVGQGFEELLAQVRTTGQPHEAREMPSTIRRNGQLEEVYCDFVYLPTYAADGTIDGVMVVATEVTAQVEVRRQMEQLNHELETRVRERTRQLVAQQHLLSQILLQVPAALATLTGPEHRYSFFNDSYAALTSGRAQLDATVAECLPEVVTQGFIDLLDKVYTTGKPFIGSDMPLRLHDHTTDKPMLRYVDFVYQPLLDGQGQTQGILAFIIDTTDKVLARRQADTLQTAVLAAVRRQKEERENVFQLFEQSPAAICLLREPAHRIDYRNPAYQDLFPGLRLLGRPLTEVQPDAIALLALLDDIYKTGKPQFQPEVPIVTTPLHGPPATRYFDFTYQAYREQEHIVGVAIFGLDVTEQVLARHQVQELNEELATSNEALQTTNEELGTTNHRLTRTNADLDTFVYTASHDLKVPIANIEGLLDALSRDLRGKTMGAAVPQIMDMMQEAVARFQQTIGHLTDIARLQQESSTTHKAVNLATIIADVQLDLAPLLQTTGAQVAVELAGTPELPLSPKNLRSVVYNLLSNALKYRHPDRVPVVRIQAWQGHTAAVLEVADNGLGLDERQQQRLFGLFQRLHPHIEGSGVGLYMVKKIVENAGGSIQVRSQAGTGSTFTVTFPVSQERKAAANS